MHSGEFNRPKGTGAIRQRREVAALEKGDRGSEDDPQFDSLGLQSSSQGQGGLLEYRGREKTLDPENR